MSDEHVTIEATRLALKCVASTDHDENERAFLLALKSTVDPHERMSIAFHATRILAMKIRESAHAVGQLDHVLEAVNLALAEMLLEGER